MAVNRIMAAIAFATFCVFLGILLARVGRIDLGLVICITLGLAAYDLWLQLFRRRPR